MTSTRQVWPLTAPQLGIWNAQRLAPDNPIFNTGQYLDISAEVEVDLFRRAIRHVVADTQALWSRPFERDGRPFQELHPGDPGQVDVPFIDVSEAVDPDVAALEFMRTDLRQPVRLDDGPLFHQAMIRVGDHHYRYYQRAHHLMLDGAGMAAVMRRVVSAYSTLLAGGSAADLTAAEPISLLLDEEFSERTTARRTADLAYWRSEFTDVPDYAGLSGRIATTAPEFLRTTLELTGLDAVIACAHACSVTWPEVLTAAWAAYTHRMTGADDLVLGIPLAAGLGTVAHRVPGMSVRVVPVRLRVHSADTVPELIRGTADQLREAARHRTVGAEELCRALDLGERTRLHGAQVNFLPFFRPPAFPGGSCRMHNLAAGPVDDLSLLVYDREPGRAARIDIDANPALYTAAELTSHARRFHDFLHTFVRAADGSDTVGGLDLLNATEWAALQQEWNQSAHPVPNRTLVDLIQDRVRTSPSDTALIWDDSQLTYSQLNAEANRLAHRLIDLGATADAIVAVGMHRSPRLVIALLAILKAGAAFLPLDPDYPAERLGYMIEDARPVVVLTETTTSLATGHIPTLALDDPAVATDLASRGNENPCTGIEPGHSAYVLYTSGSTGKPKGVVIEHAGIVNRLLWMQSAFGLTTTDRVLQKTPSSFDVSVWEFFWPLFTGAALVLARPGGHREPDYLAREIQRHSVTTIHFVPSMLRAFLEEPTARDCTSLTTVICSGEELSAELCAAFHRTLDAGLHNLYGPTEASIDVTWWECRPDRTENPVPIGHPIWNTRTLVLDPNRRPLPTGVAGELYLGGTGLARGYLRRPDLTAERFVDDPFRPGERLYRTGDRARIRPDGAVEFLGRIDDQIKLRGLRIELGEIETALREVTRCEEVAVVVVTTANGAQTLVGCARTDDHPDPITVRDRLSEWLPAHMVPSHYLWLGRMPLTPSGKLDRRTLAAQAVSTMRGPTADHHTPPRNEIEQRLAHIWATVLERDAVGIDDRLYDLGIDSIVAIRLAGAMRQAGWAAEVHELMRRQTIRGLMDAGAITHKAASAAWETTKPFALLDDSDRHRLSATIVDAYPATQLQLGMIYHTDLDPNRAAFHDVFTYRLALPLDRTILSGLLARMVADHDVLRTSFALAGYSRPLQLVHQRAEPVLAVYDLRHLDDAGQRRAVRLWTEGEKHTPFRWEIPAMLRFAVHDLAAAEFTLSIGFHHSILDGWSFTQLIARLVDDYRRAVLGLPPVAASPTPPAYRDYVAALETAQQDREAHDHWRRVLADQPPTPALTTLPPLRTGPRWTEAELDLGAQASQRLAELARQHGLPVRNICLAMHFRAQAMLSGTDDVTTGVFNHGRLEHPDAERMIGLFLNVQPIRITVPPTEAELYGSVTDALHTAMRYPRYSYASILASAKGIRPDQTAVNFVHFRTLADRLGADGNRVIIETKVFEHTDYSLLVTFVTDPFTEQLTVLFNADGDVIDETRMDEITAVYHRLAVEFLGAPGPLTDLRDEHLENDRAGQILAVVADVYHETTGREPDLESELLDFTPDSITRLRLAAELRSRTGLDLPLRTLLSAAPVRDLVKAAWASTLSERTFDDTL
ncbi:amino acid adenylation domain-containing protein [Nocardia huaxiensis]|uniref:Amino acid adenylation domain-containing protein n=1 Tax=Nocardia huaxiensis TaxID=2755382 RepID=A0A7D6ZLL0_9NOCA|nr:non-ribosomal peptide synthetase [Nocardia huaxiensis]QLY33567.1 amino acid adenylation domain-containing protein [Nocardia huaxiensis]